MAFNLEGDSIGKVAKESSTSTSKDKVDRIIDAAEGGNYTLAFFILFIILTVLFMNKAISDRTFRQDIASFFKRASKKVNLRKHHLFSYAAIADTYVDRLKMSSQLKTDVFKLILTVKTKVVIDESRRFITLFEKKEYDKEVFSEVLNGFTSSMICKYEKLIKDKLGDKYGEDGEFLYNYIYKERFEPHHSMNVTYILKMLNRFDESGISDRQTVYMYFSLLYVALDVAILDCEQVFRNINGSLKIYEEKYGN